MNKELMKKMGFTQEVKSVEKGSCPLCHQDITWQQFRDELSKREYRISGMCQCCQDRIFA